MYANKNNRNWFFLAKKNYVELFASHIVFVKIRSNQLYILTIRTCIEK